MIKSMLEYLVRELVDEPEKVIVSELDGLHKTTYEIVVAGEDIGKVVGKQGRIARALRVIVKGVAAGDPHEVHVVIHGDGKRPRGSVEEALVEPTHPATAAQAGLGH